MSMVSDSDCGSEWMIVQDTNIQKLIKLYNYYS